MHYGGDDFSSIFCEFKRYEIFRFLKFIKEDSRINLPTSTAARQTGSLLDPAPRRAPKLIGIDVSNFP